MAPNAQQPKAKECQEHVRRIALLSDELFCCDGFARFHRRMITNDENVRKGAITDNPPPIGEGRGGLWVRTWQG